MERLQRAAVILSLIESLRSAGSWCGETHIQKATYFLQELFGVPLEYDFILYRYGPFAFDLRDDLASMRADNLLKLEIQNPYGPSILPTTTSDRVKKLYPKTAGLYAPQIQAIATKLGKMGVAQLERLATALYVTLQHPDQDAASRAQGINALKTHVSLTEATNAVQEIDNFIAEARTVAVR